MNSASPSFEIFVVSQPGLETVTAMELQSMGVEGKLEQGGVSFRGGLPEIYRVNLWSRSAVRVLVRIGRFRLTRLSDVVERFQRYPWEIYGAALRESGVRVRVTTHKSRLYHTGAIAERVLEGIEGRVGRRGMADNVGRDGSQEMLVIVRIVRDRCVVSVDSSGLPLYMRGYRKRGVRATIRENLAASVLLLSGWKPGQSLFDPFCGSGTIPVEAALMEAGIPPGMNRDFAFMKWKNFDRMQWEALECESKPGKIQEAHGAKNRIYAADLDARAVGSARLNAEAAGVSHMIEFKEIRFGPDAVPPCQEPGWIVTNPPYGRRVHGRGKRGVYSELGSSLKRNFAAWNIACLAPSALKELPGRKSKSLAAFLNGGFRVRVLESRV